MNPILPDDSIEAASSISAHGEAGPGGGRRIVGSIVGLVLGVAALGLAIIPGFAYDQPPELPFGALGGSVGQERVGIRDNVKDAKKDGITLAYKDFSVTLGGKKKAKDAEDAAVLNGDSGDAKTAPGDAGGWTAQLTKNPVARFTIAAIVIALVGIMTAAIAQVRERHAVLTTCAMSCCVIAIGWQYIAAGIAVGAAAAVFLIVLALLGSALS